MIQKIKDSVSILTQKVGLCLHHQGLKKTEKEKETKYFIDP